MSNGNVEQMLTQLLKIVGTMQTDIQELKVDMGNVKNDIQELKIDMGNVKNDIGSLKGEVQSLQSQMQTLTEKSDQRHVEVMKKLKELEHDQDFIWEKAVRNERELGSLKRQLS